MLPYPWRLFIGLARTALGIACLALHLTYSNSAISWALIPLTGFVLYSLFAMKRGMESGGVPAFVLVVDCAAFVAWYSITGSYAPHAGAWSVLALAIYLFLISSAVLSHDWRWVLGVMATCLAVASFAPAADLIPVGPSMIWCAVLSIVWMVHNQYLERRLARASRHSVLYRFEAQQAREDERERIAADFHDGPLQSFIGLQMRLEILKKMMARDPQMAVEELRQLQELCQSQVGELRSFVRSMRPLDVEGSSLGASISRMVEQFQKDTGISASFLSGEYVDPAETGVSLELLQIVREALNNVQKHSRATRVAVTLNRNGDYLEISVNDDGDGFPFSGSFSLDELDLLRLGPLSIRRRVRALGGELNLDSRPGQGAGLLVRVTMS